MIEQLETRRLFQVTLGKTGILTITGTDGPDVIGVASTFVPELQPNGTVVRVQRLTFNVNGIDELTVTKSKIKRAVVNLGDGDDSFIVGTNKKLNFRVDGGLGNDTISTSNGNDILDGGPGDDFLFGGSNADTLICNEGNDTLLGGDGTDTADYSGQTENLRLTLNDLADDGIADLFETGNLGSDIETVIGGSGHDVISADGNSEFKPVSLFGDNGNDTLQGSLGPDTLQGGRGNDSINGSAGDDILIGDAGRDLLNGGPGIDRLFGGGASRDLFDSDGLWPPIQAPVFPGDPEVDPGRVPIPSIDNFKDTLNGQGGEDIAFSDFLDILRTI